MNIEQQLEANQSRRMAAQDKFIGRIEQRENDAEQMIGELCRNGKPVFYTFPLGGKYREGKRLNLVAYLIRNNYA